MIKKEYTRQTVIEMVSIEQLVPQDHPLRKIEEIYDFSFVRRRMEPLYCQNNGRPAIDPVMLFKMMFIGYMFGIRSERQLEQEIKVNVAYRWFLNLGLMDSVPDHSTISQNRRRRFQGTDVFRRMFEDVVEHAYDKGFIEGKLLFTDSTHLKANANKKKLTKELVRQSTKAYLEELERDINEDRIAHNKRPLPPAEQPEEEPEKLIKVSTTDPESGYMARTNKPEGFHFLDHRTCDGMYNIITDTYVTPGNVNDSTVYLDRLVYQRSMFGFEVKEVGLDAGYFTPYICKTLSEENVFGVISYRKPGGTKGLYRRSKFNYDRDNDCYICPEGHVLKYVTTNRTGFRQYNSDPRVCRLCPRLSECTRSKKCLRIVERHVWESYNEIIKSNRETDRGEYIKKRRSETIERSFADAKQLHGYRYARFRGLEKVESQALMTAITQNIKKIVSLMTRKGDSTEKGRKNSIKSPIFGLVLQVYIHLMVPIENIAINTA